MSKQRKLLLVKITESDGATPKVAKPAQNFSYDELLNQTFIESYEIQLGYSAVFIPQSANVLEGMNLRTSMVQDVKYSESNFVEKMVVKTMNTIYFFEVIG
ncbi:hypothetical protein [Paenibacillus agilis]|uniref:Uncharacterized protein n=1 Tax=Paenibacillus agilis TaxID=3020863 RepID=A0A559IEB3_9BACL|nr:hypothetical protein [Paenibacillus agilis]TVX85997.1 hypothetical protein FPZ44_23910 [Paenibacillus agilis]